MNRITNYIPHWCCMDGINDKDWGCGWRSLQTLQSQLNISQDIFTVAFELKLFTGDNELLIDYDNSEISMAEMESIGFYFVSIAKQNGYKNANLNILMINDMFTLQNVADKLNYHFNIKKSKTLVLIGTGGNIGLISGFKEKDNEIYLIDPHISSFNIKFGNCKGIGRGGQGWVSLKDTVLYGKELLHMNDKTFLEYNPALVITFDGIEI